MKREGEDQTTEQSGEEVTKAGSPSADSSERGEPGDKAEETSSGSQGKGSSGTGPKDIPSGDDDDVVARQLREAAEKEQDPELREKLWEEYRNYKKQQTIVNAPPSNPQNSNKTEQTTSEKTTTK